MRHTDPPERAGAQEGAQHPEAGKRQLDGTRGGPAMGPLPQGPFLLGIRVEAVGVVG